MVRYNRDMGEIYAIPQSCGKLVTSTLEPQYSWKRYCNAHSISIAVLLHEYAAVCPLLVGSGIYTILCYNIHLQFVSQCCRRRIRVRGCWNTTQYLLTPLIC